MAKRYPVARTVPLEQRQDDELRTTAAAINRPISQVARDAMAAGLPVLRKRAERDGTLVAAPEAVEVDEVVAA